MGTETGAARLGIDTGFFDEPYQPHPLHVDATNHWIDANCYTDLWIELLHGLRLDPYPMLAFTLGLDFEGDQWTFFKPPHRDLEQLYGIEVVELAIYDSLAAHALSQLRHGRVPLLEADGFFLPDVPATYHTVHAKTTIAVIEIAIPPRLARYLHNAGSFVLAEDDFDGVFRLGRHAPTDGILPPYVESAKLDLTRALDPLSRAAHARSVARRCVERRRVDAIDRFAQLFERDRRRLATLGQEWFSSYAFGTLRQLGAGAALAARFLRWLDRDLGPGADGWDAVSSGAKRLILKCARSAATGREVDASETFAQLSAAWCESLDFLAARLAR